MKTDKLFNLLVLGGALLVTNVAQADRVEGSPTFCSPYDASKPIEENSCVLNEEGKGVVREGFECCWGTSCEST